MLAASYTIPSSLSEATALSCDHDQFQVMILQNLEKLCIILLIINYINSNEHTGVSLIT